MRAIREKLSCPYPPCKVLCKKPNSLTRHIQDVHNSMDDSKMCPTCGTILGNRNSFSNHMRLVHTGPILHCSKCSYTTRNISSLKLHFKLRHTESMKQSCEYCGKVFKKLKKHLKNTMCGKDVDDRKLQQCPQCDRKSRNKRALRNHVQNIHNKVKDIQCPNCSYQTYNRFNLRLHVSKVHEKTTIFRNCPHCESRTGNLEAHLATYHSEQM